MQKNKGNYEFAHTTPYKGIARVYGMAVQIDRPKERSGRQYFAIWDTGASGTCISNKLAEFLKLEPVSFVDTNTANGAVRCPVSLVDIRFESGLTFQNVTVTVANLLTYDALIGTDIISLGDFSVTNLDGETCVTFGVPSIKKHDYVKEAHINDIISKGHMPKRSN